MNNISIISAAFNDTHAYKFMLRFYICSKVKLTLCENWCFRVRVSSIQMTVSVSERNVHNNEFNFPASSAIPLLSWTPENCIDWAWHGMALHHKTTVELTFKIAIFGTMGVRACRKRHWNIWNGGRIISLEPCLAQEFLCLFVANPPISRVRIKCRLTVT